MNFRNLLVLVCLLVAPSAFADVEYYTYGGHESVVNAFYRLAAIFNDTDFEYLVYAAAGAGVIAGYLITMGKGFIGQGLKLGDSLFSLFVTLFGVSIYIGAMQPTTTVHVYDETINEYEAVGGVPSLIAYAVELPNLLERAFTIIVDGSTVYGRDQHANGKSMELLLNALNTNPLAHETYLNRSLYSYVNTCMPPGLSSNLYTFNLNEFMSTSTSLLAELEKLKSASVNVIYYDAANRGGVEVTCADAFDSMSPLLTAVGTYTEHTEKICEKSGFDSADAVQLADCRTRIQTISDLVFGAGTHGSDTKIYLDQAIARATYDLLSNYAGTAVSDIANYREISQGYGNVIVAEGWIPAIRGATAVIILSITPILAVFLVTPMLFKALHLLVTLFFFVGIWGVTDAIIHANIMDQVAELMNSISSYNGSLTAFMMAPGEINKGLAIFGKMQSLGVMLATLFSAIFFKLSARPFAMAGERLADNIESVGSRAGEEVMDPHSKINTQDNAQIADARLDYRRQVGNETYANALAGQGTESLRAEVGYLDGMSSHGNFNNPGQAFDIRGGSMGGRQAGDAITTANNAKLSHRPVADYSADMSGTESAMHQAGTRVDQENIQRLSDENWVSTSQATEQYAQINKADQTAKTIVSGNPDDHLVAAEVTETQHMKDKQSFKAAIEDNNMDMSAKVYEEAGMRHRQAIGEHRANVKFQKENNLTPEQAGQRKAMTDLEGTEAQQLSRELMVNEGMASSELDAAYRMEAGQFGAFLAEHNSKEALAAFLGTSVGTVYQNTAPDNHINLSQGKAAQMLESINMSEEKMDAIAQLREQIESVRRGDTDVISLPSGELTNESWQTLSDAGLSDRVTGGYEGSPLEVTMDSSEARDILALSDPEMQEFARNNQNALETIAASPQGGNLSTGLSYETPGSTPSQTNTRATVDQSTHVDTSDSIHKGLKSDEQTGWSIFEEGNFAQMMLFAERATASEGTMNSTSHTMARNLLGQYRQQEDDQYRFATDVSGNMNVNLSKKGLANFLESDNNNSSSSTAVKPDKPADDSASKDKTLGDKAAGKLKQIPIDGGIAGQGTIGSTWSETSGSEFNVDVAQNEILKAFEAYASNSDKEQAVQQLQDTLQAMRELDRELGQTATNEYSNDFVEGVEDPSWWDDLSVKAAETIEDTQQKLKDYFR